MLVIDGHNLIGRTKGLGLDREEEGRDRIIGLVAALKAHKGERVVVVFDGNRPHTQPVQSIGSVRIVYSSGGDSGDDEVVKQVRSGGGAVTVVTSDRQLCARVKELGASVLSSNEFASRLKRPSKDKSTPAKPQPDESDTAYWLDKFEKS